MSTLSSAVIASGGNSYVLGDVLTPVGGTYTTRAVMQVTSVSSGVVTGLSVLNDGDYSVVPSNPVSLSGGSGAGCTITATWGNGIDLTTVSAVQAWLNIPATQDVANIQSIISSLGVYWLRRTGQMPNDGQIPTSSPFITPISYGPEYYDGNGNYVLYLRHWPIVSVSLLQINGQTIPQSTAWGQAGFVINAGSKSLAFQGTGNTSGFNYGRGMGTPYSYWFNFSPTFSFCPGVQNVAVTYTAGYNGTPFDVAEACTKMAAIIYKRRENRYLDMKQNMKLETGQFSFFDWEWPPEIEAVICRYQRMAIV